MTPKQDGIYAMYLRKSRADLDAEKIGQYETLARHEQMLYDLADRYGIKIAKTYKELVSGDTIEARPEMKLLLTDVSSGVYDGVLVTEISRLARGNTTDQGIVSEAFRASKTLIITPSKIYDPTDEADETFFDFELFMARQEYRYIKKRMQRGRQLSRDNGNWLYIPPFGYKRDGKRLVPDDHAETMRQILLDIADGTKTKTEARRYLQKIVPEYAWAKASFQRLVTNPLYAGYMTPIRKYANADTFDTSQYIQANCVPLITLEDHERIIARISPQPRIHVGEDMVNAFSGLIRCADCGRVMLYSSNHGYACLYHQYMEGQNRCNCHRISYKRAYDELIPAILDQLPDAEYQKEDDRQRIEDQISEIRKKIARTEKIKSELFDKFETGLYTADEFRARKQKREDEITALTHELKTLENKKTTPFKVTTADLKDAISTGTPKEVNDLLRILIDHIDYARKEKKGEPVFTLYFR